MVAGFRPGEIVWTWVPFEQSPSEGKDRPVLIVDEEDGRLFGLAVMTRTGSRDYTREQRAGRHWMDIGAWGRDNRRSEVRLDQVITLDPTQLRSSGAYLDTVTFIQVRNAYWDLR